MNSQKMQLAVESYFPGRMRLRVPKQYRQASTMAGIASALRAATGVEEVKNSIKTGSLLLKFDPDVMEIAEIVAVLEAANVVLDMGVHLGEAALQALERSSGPTVSKVAGREYDNLRTVDTALHRITGGATSLRSILLFLIPAVIAVGIWHEQVAPEKLVSALKRLVTAA